MFRLFDIVSLLEDDKKHGVKKEYIGAIVDILSDGKAYTVEFLDDKGNTIEEALFTEYKENELRLVSHYKSKGDNHGP